MYKTDELLLSNGLDNFFCQDGNIEAISQTPFLRS